MPNLDMTRITGRIALPDDTNLTGAKINFQLTGFDADNALDITVLDRPVSGDIDASGDIDVTLWSNDRGVRGRKYNVWVEVTDGRKVIDVPLGTITLLPDSDTTQDINDLLDVTLSDAMDSAAFVGVRFGTVAEMVADQFLSVGQVVETTGYHAAGDAGGNTYLVVPAGTGTADGGAFIDLEVHQAEATFPGGFKGIKQFGAKTDGTDCTSQISAWLKSGGRLLGQAGKYTFAAAGADAGGALAVISKSITVDCDEGFVAVAGDGLDNDIIRIHASQSGYSADRKLSVVWRGGMCDQRLQKNSTSLPFPDAFPPPNPGASATTDGLSIRGEISVDGVPTAGFHSVSVTGLKTRASDDDHWETAGGDGGLFIDGTVHIHVENGHHVGARDLGVYCSGLSSGAVPGGSCYIGANRLHGCMFGVASKRLLSNVQMVDNTGINTAALVLSTDVTETGDNVRISGNIAQGAWKAIRVTGGDDATIENNHSVNHGHFMRDGTTIGTPFTAGNCCVSLEGTTRPVVHGNSLRGRGTGFTLAASTVLLGDDASSTKTTGALVHGNSGDDVMHVVDEESGGSDFMVAFDNEGTNLSGIFPVALRGPSSINKSAPIYETNTRVTVTGTTDVTTMASKVIKAGIMQRDYFLRINAGGTIEGTAGTKGINLLIGAVDSTFFLPFDATTVGEWYLDFTLRFNTLQSIRFDGSLHTQNGSVAAFKRGNVDFATEDNTISVTGDLSNGADSIILDHFSIRFD